MARKDVPQTVVEFRDHEGAPPGTAPHKTYRVFINGAEVLIPAGDPDIRVETGVGGSGTTVTLSFYATEVHFNR